MKARQQPLHFHAEVQTHLLPLWHCGASFLLINVLYMTYSSLAHVLSYSVVCAITGPQSSAFMVIVARVYV